MNVRKAAGSHRNYPIGLIINKPSSIFTKYVPGSGVGASSTANRRAKLRNATNCLHSCESTLGLYTKGGTNNPSLNYILSNPVEIVNIYQNNTQPI